jgi:hypothetical protein
MATMNLNLKGKTFGIKNTLAYPVLGLGALALAGGALVMTGNLNLSSIFPSQEPPKPATPNAVRVMFNVYPPTVKPFRKLRLQGQFEDMNGQVAIVPMGYYTIFENVPQGPYFSAGRLITSRGILGTNVGAFKIDVATDNFRTGPYTVYVSNRPILEDPLKGALAEQSLLGDFPATIG